MVGVMSAEVGMLTVYTVDMAIGSSSPPPTPKVISVVIGVYLGQINKRKWRE